MANFTYVIADTDSPDVAVVDPSWDLQRIFQMVDQQGWKMKYVINTHSHFDHVLGNTNVVKATGAKIIQHKSSQLPKDISVVENDIISIGSINVNVLHTPGHSDDSICLIIDNKLVLTGDTLFVGGVGRVDLPGSNPELMYHSLYNKVLALDDNLTVYPGHDYGAAPTSTIGQERDYNFALQAKSKHEFLAFMGAG